MTRGRDRVGQWMRFEAALENLSAYGDPYRDVALEAAYRRPDGTVLHTWGFYDGGQTWRARCMPDQVGTWHYTLAFSDGAPGASGSFTCLPAPPECNGTVPGMLAADETNPVWFGFKGGAHVLIRSLHVGDRFFAGNWPEKKRSAFLDWAQGQGYNLLSVASHYLNRPQPGRGEGWQTPALWPLDAAEYRKVERILDDLSARRLMVYPFAGFFGQAGNFPTDPDEQVVYMRYTLARWGAYWNLLLNVSGPEPLLAKRPTLSREEVNRLGALIASENAYGHPLSVHNQTGPDAFMGEAWPSYGILQGPKTTDVEHLGDVLLANHHPYRPLYAQETLWSGNQHGHPDYSDDELRVNAYTICMSAAALNFSDNGGPRVEEIGNSSSGFSGTLELDDRRQWRHDIVKRVWDFFETIPFWTMRPRQDLVSAGRCLAEEEARYLVYLPTGGAVDVALRGGPYRATWINARDTADRRPASRGGAGAAGGGQRWVVPAEGEDWLLYIER